MKTIPGLRLFPGRKPGRWHSWRRRTAAFTFFVIPLKCPACGDKSITNFFRRNPAGSWIIDEAVCRCRECGHWFYSADTIDKEEDFGKCCFMQAEQMREAELKLARAAERSAARGGSAPAPPGKPDAAPARRTDKTKGEIKRFLIGAIGAVGLIALFKEAAGADFPFGVVWAAAVIAAAAYLAYKLLPNESDGGGDAAGQASPARSETASMAGNDELPGAEHAAAPAVSEQSVRAGQTIDTPRGKIIIDLMVSRMIFSGGICCKERYRGRTLDGRRVTVVIRSGSGGNRSVRVRPYQRTSLPQYSCPLSLPASPSELSLNFTFHVPRRPSNPN